MEDNDVSRQLQQMMAFIKQEADEKAHEVSISSEEESDVLKQEIFEVEQQKIKQEYDRKEKQVDTRKKIEYSMQLNNSRLRVLQAQDDLVQDIKKAAQVQMYTLSADHTTYKHLIRDLIVQGLIKLKEPHLVLKCRHADLKLVKSVLQLAKDRFAAKMKDHPPDVVIDEETFLPAADELNTPGRTCAGGVILTSRDGRVICDNTLDSRLEVTFKQILPEIRRRFFGT
ncbi:hypothetical protein GOP47_0010614 [Adiantum capillus-veneris]|uniref:Uncharacterized protein n=1 Tax=Adiantum capillus-veneris TaxID=13818 RepID=A0A9D4UV88_ADICA|nr:hypothetical protein GOP47_0010614 [Adiantum capillus-veneris]